MSWTQISSVGCFKVMWRSNIKPIVTYWRQSAPTCGQGLLSKDGESSFWTTEKTKPWMAESGAQIPRECLVQLQAAILEHRLRPGMKLSEDEVGGIIRSLISRSSLNIARSG